mmetsp:Transcript_544/g.1249  ORF Transcript_544/g.1249 Transcript_544/m.1249 type:complete len:331 (-) Transcript_544:530-1522(-)
MSCALRHIPREVFPRVHYPVRVERRLHHRHRVHHAMLLDPSQELVLRLSQPVLRGHGPPPPPHRAVHDRLDARREGRIPFGRPPRDDVDVRVAVRDVTPQAHGEVGGGRILQQELPLHLPSDVHVILDRDRHVELVNASRPRHARIARFPYPPHLRQLLYVPGEESVADQVAVVQASEEGVHFGTVVVQVGPLRFHQEEQLRGRGPRLFRGRNRSEHVSQERGTAVIDVAATVFLNKAQRIKIHQFHRAHDLAQLLLRGPQYPQNAIVRVTDQQGSVPRRGQGRAGHGHLGDNPQRALRPDEEVFEIVSRVVLAMGAAFGYGSVVLHFHV